MDEEIDLRIYLSTVLRHWKWIVALALGAAAAGFVFSLLLPPLYKATSVVLVIQPRYQIQFDPRFGTEDQTPAYRAFPALATSDRILVQVAGAYVPPAEAGLEEWTPAVLLSMVGATSGGDPSLVQLWIEAPLPEMAADLANVWADVLVEEGNRIYGGGEEDVAFFQEQLQQAQAALDAAEAAQVEFEARDESSTVRAQLDSLRHAQADYLANQRQIASLVQDIQGLREQLAEQPGDEPVSLGDSLTTLFLQIKAFNVEASTPIQLQFESAAAVSEKTLAEQIDFLDNLAATLEERSNGIDERLAELEPLILSSQQTLQELQVENNRLDRAQRVAEETYLTLARKADEARIAAQENKGLLQVGSYAAVPQRQAGPRRIVLMGVAGMLGLMTGIAGVLVIDFWRQSRR
jgi:uncharacterized protein involved in exopolysaccharide biosynthesis